ncbi:hypothetical protein [Bradyrhizobium sp. UFLA05-112]
MMSALIAIGATSVICFVLMTHVQDRSRRRSRAAAGANGGDSYSGNTDGFALGSWFFSDNSSSSVDSSGNPIGSGSCSSSDSISSDSSGGGGGDCGGGGDSGGGGGD